MDDAAPPSRPVHEEQFALRRRWPNFTRPRRWRNRLSKRSETRFSCSTPDFRVRSGQSRLLACFTSARRRRKASPSMRWAMGNGIFQRYGRY